MSGMDGFGASLSRGNNDATSTTEETFSPIGNLTSITVPGFARDTYDVTAHDAADKWREWIGGLLDGGEVSCDINYDPALQIGAAGDVYTVLVGDAENPDPVNYEIALPDGSKFACALLITSFDDIDVPFDDKVTGSITWKMSGKPTFTAAA